MNHNVRECIDSQRQTISELNALLDTERQQTAQYRERLNIILTNNEEQQERLFRYEELNRQAVTSIEELTQIYDKTREENEVLKQRDPNPTKRLTELESELEQLYRENNEFSSERDHLRRDLRKGELEI